MSVVKHSFVSAVPDSANPNEVQGSDWNAPHVFDPPVKGLLYDAVGSGNIVGLQTVGLLQDRVGDGTITPVRVKGLLNDPLGDGNIVGVSVTGIIGDPDGDGNFQGIKVTGLWNDDGTGNISGVRHRGLLMDKAGNGVYNGVDVTGVYVNPTGNNNVVGVAAANAGQVLRRKFNTPTVEYEFKDLPRTNVADYSFLMSSIPQNVTANVANIITCNPLPLGINANSVIAGHRLLFQGNDGLNSEVVTITAVSGNTFTCTPTLNRVAGNWRISTATSGIQEAFNAVDSPYLMLGSGDYYIWAQVTLWCKDARGFALIGNGIGNTRLIRHETFAGGGHCLNYDSTKAAGATTFCLIQDFTLVNSYGFDTGASYGIGLKTQVVNECHVSRVRVENGRYPIVLESGSANPNGSTLVDCQVFVTTSYSSAYFTGDGISCSAPSCRFINCTSIIQVNASLFAGSNPSGLIISRCNDTNVYGGSYSGKYGISISPQLWPTFAFNTLTIQNVTIKGTWSSGIGFSPGAHHASFNRISILNCIIDQQNIAGGALGHGIEVINNPEGLIIAGNQISGFRGSGIYFGAVNNVPRGGVISGNAINNNSQGGGGGYGIVIAATGVSATAYDINLTITSNQIGNAIKAYGADSQVIGIYFINLGAGSKFIGINVVGNNLAGNTFNSIYYDGGPTFQNCVIKNNVGVDDVVQVVDAVNINAVGGSQFFATFYLTASVPITNITPVWHGREVSFINVQAASISFAAGGNITIVGSIAQYQILTLWYSANFSGWLIKSKA